MSREVSDRAKRYLELQDEIRKLRAEENKLSSMRIDAELSQADLLERCKACRGRGSVDGDGDWGWTTYQCSDCRGVGTWLPDDIKAALELRAAEEKVARLKKVTP